MPRKKDRASNAAALLFLHVFFVTAAASEPRQSRASDSEAAKQTTIYQSRGEDVPQGYVIDRSLLSYLFVLPAELRNTLTSLGPGDRWLDIGAGEGRAILDYATAKYDVMLQDRGAGKARAVAVSIEDRRTARWHDTVATLGPGHIQYLAGKRFREYSLVELGQFQVITDVVGAFSYTRYLSQFMEQALGSLEVNGTLYTLLQDVRSEEGTNQPFYPGASFSRSSRDRTDRRSRCVRGLRALLA